MAFDHPSLAGHRAIMIGGPDLGASLAARMRRADADVTELHWGDAAGIDADDAAAVGAATEAEVKRQDSLDVLVIDMLPLVAPRPLDATGPAIVAQALARVGGVATAMAAAFPALRRSTDARIIIIGHRYGQGVAEGIAPYNAAAWALVGLTRSAALDWGRYGIATTLLLPGAATAQFEAARAARPALIDALVAQLPLGRMGDPFDDIGGAVVMLAGPAGRFINGQTIHADGGRHIAGAVIDPARISQTR